MIESPPDGPDDLETPIDVESLGDGPARRVVRRARLGL